jgi:hypothetical protein
MTMDVYIAAMGRSGSTALANWLTIPPTHFVLHEPGLLRSQPTRLLGMQLSGWGVTLDDVMSAHWAAKEVEPHDHDPMIAAYSPARILICVRDIREAVKSYLEKHRVQGLLDRFDDRWTRDYVIECASSLVRLANRLDAEGKPWRIARYEEFARDPDRLADLAGWIGWPGGGDTSAGFKEFDRGYEADRHVRELGSSTVAVENRGLDDAAMAVVAEVTAATGDYQRRFYGER